MAKIYQLIKNGQIVFEGTNSEARAKFGFKSHLSSCISGNSKIMGYEIKALSEEEDPLWRYHQLIKHGNTICLNEEKEDVLEELNGLGMKVSARWVKGDRNGITGEERSGFWVLEI